MALSSVSLSLRGSLLRVGSKWVWQVAPVISPRRRVWAIVARASKQHGDPACVDLAAGATAGLVVALA